MVSNKILIKFIIEDLFHTYTSLGEIIVIVSARFDVILYEIHLHDFVNFWI